MRRKKTVKELIELLKQFPENMPVNMQYDGLEYDYVHDATILPVRYGEEQQEELFLLNYWEAQKLKKEDIWCLKEEKTE